MFNNSLQLKNIRQLLSGVIYKTCPRFFRFCSIHITHYLCKKVARCEGHILCFGNSRVVITFSALCPQHNTRGTSGVSLFLLNPRGVSVYNAPKYEPIFSIIQWSPGTAVCRARFTDIKWAAVWKAL